MRPQDRYTYQNAGFNGFMLRSMKSNPAAQNLAAGISKGSGKPIAFDQRQMTGSLGDIVKIGRIRLNGPAGRIEFLNEDETEDVGWAGDLEG